MFAWLRAAVCLLVLAWCSAAMGIEDRFDAAKAAREILDDSTPSEKREQLVAASVPHAAETIAAMVKDLPDDQDEEYRRIPWIWRVAIAAGRENDDAVLIELLQVSLPQENQPLADWQSVVIGGGIINGISQAGQVPRIRLDDLLGHKEVLLPRWQRTIHLAAEMVQDAETPSGTRYDALRILGAADWKTHGELITKYLSADAHEELQMGAVSAAGDMTEEEAALTLIKHMSGLTDNNRAMAIDALMHPKSSLKTLRAAVQAGRVREQWLSAEQTERLQATAQP